MEIGDPKKTLVTGVIAVVVVGVAVWRVMPANESPKALRQAPDAPTAPAAGGAVASTQLDELRVDAFSHPKLAARSDAAAPLATNPGPATEGGASGSPLPDVIRDPGFGPTIDKTKPQDWPVPYNPIQKGAETQVEKLTQIELKAIVKFDERRAYVSVDGQDAREYKAGDFIKSGIQVVFVNEDSVIVKTSKTTATLKVGQRGEI